LQVKDGFYNRAYYGTTLLDPLGAAAVAILGIATLIVPRRAALIPYIILICFVPCTQRVSVFGLDFNLMRILILFGWARVFMKGEYRGFELMKLDKLMLAFILVKSAVYVVLHKNFGAVITMSGMGMEALGGYFLVRMFVRSWDDVMLLAKAIAIIAVPTAITFIIEKATHKNLFSVFGGVPEITMIRYGKLRATGALGNPILAGCYWAGLLPIVGALTWARGSVTKLLGPTGIVCSLVIIMACASSTPMAATMAAFLGAALFKLRHRMADIRKGVVYTLCGLHLVMKGPVWHLLARIDLVGGSTGYHRFLLVDQWLRRIPEWAPIGVKGTYHWGWGLADITNQYVLESVRGGMAGFVLFMWMLWVAFAYLGQVWRSVEKDRQLLAMSWGLGVALFTHCMAFIAVSYFGQMYFGFIMNVALCASLMQALERQRATAEEGEPVEEEVLTPAHVRPRRLLGAT
jgi:hypothetical protein